MRPANSHVALIVAKDVLRMALDQNPAFLWQESVTQEKKKWGMPRLARKLWVRELNPALLWQEGVALREKEMEQALSPGIEPGSPAGRI